MRCIALAASIPAFVLSHILLASPHCIVLSYYHRNGRDWSNSLAKEINNRACQSRSQYNLERGIIVVTGRKRRSRPHEVYIPDHNDELCQYVRLCVFPLEEAYLIINSKSKLIVDSRLNILLFHCISLSYLGRTADA